MLFPITIAFKKKEENLIVPFFCYNEINSQTIEFLILLSYQLTKHVSLKFVKIIIPANIKPISTSKRTKIIFDNFK
jgi:hypothetical protein